MPNNLYEFYTQQGQSLPSIQERAQLYQQMGLGSAGEYRGTADQNTRLLGMLQGRTSNPYDHPMAYGPNRPQPPESHMNSQEALLNALNNPNVQQMLANNPDVANTLNNLNLDGPEIDAISSSLSTGEAVTRDRMQDLIDQANMELSGYYDELQRYERANLQSQIDSGLGEYDRTLADISDQFQQSKAEDDLNKAHSGTLFSSQRTTDLNNLQDRAQRAESEARDTTKTRMSDLMRGFEYDWGTGSLKKMADQAQLGGQQYDAFKARDNVKDKGVFSVYQPRMNDFVGRRKTEQRAYAEQLANQRAGTQGQLRSLPGGMF